MRRRDFITLLGGAAAWPMSARARRVALPEIGVLGMEPGRIPMFRHGLKDAGYAEAEEVAIELHSAEVQYSRWAAVAADLVARNVTVIVAFGGPAALAAKSATSTIPIVFISGADPVTYGLVENINRPGRNVTGFYLFLLEEKRLEVLHELLPNARALAVLVNPSVVAAQEQLKNAYEAAHALGVEIRVVQAGSESDIDAGFASLVEQRIGAVSVMADPFFFLHCDQIVALAARHALPAVYSFRECATAGGLMSYGASIAEAVYQTGIYTGRILQGEKPANLPVQQSTKVELIINLKTANSLGITVPTTLLGRADEVIE